MPPVLLRWLFRRHVPSRHYRLLLGPGLDLPTPGPVFVEKAAKIRGGNRLPGEQTIF